MTENEVFEGIHNECGTLEKCPFEDNTSCRDCAIRKTLINAEKALREIRQYRAIGTVEELRALKDIERIANNLSEMEKIEYWALKKKNVPKKVNIEQWIDTKCSCGYVFSKHHGDGYHSVPYENKTTYCPNCGQKLDWE